MDRERELRRLRDRGVKAAKLMNDETFQDVFQSVRNSLLEGIEHGANTTEEREVLYRGLDGINRLRRELETRIVEGADAESDLRDLN